jgi:hypothetical protein
MVRGPAEQGLDLVPLTIGEPEGLVQRWLPIGTTAFRTR